MVVLVRAPVARAVQISEVPLPAFARTANVQVRPPPETVDVTVLPPVDALTIARRRSPDWWVVRPVVVMTVAPLVASLQAPASTATLLAPDCGVGAMGTVLTGTGTISIA